MKNKELMIVGMEQHKPQYGGRTLVEKVTAYKLSDGELIGNRESALRWQKDLDIREQIDALIKKYLFPFPATRITNEHDKDVLAIEREVVDLYSVRQFLYSYRSLLRDIE